MFEIENRHAPKNRKTNKINNKLQENTKKSLIFAGAAAIIVFIISYIYITKQNENYNNIKEQKSNYIVYTKYTNNDSKFSQNIPYVNLKGNTAKLINSDIDLFVSEFKNQKKNIISYEYDISGIILSIIVKAGDYNTEYSPRVYARSYNINLNTLEAIDNKNLLSFFGIDETTVENLIENKFKYFYNDLLKNNYYVEEECNYKCFLKYREVDNYLDNISYYIKNGNLYAYRPFIIYSIFGEEEYFTEDSYKFLLVETEKNKKEE